MTPPHYPLLPAYICSEKEWAIWCPACGHLHRHGAMPGHRVASCLINNPYEKTGYILVPTGKVVSDSVLALDREGQERERQHLKRPKNPYEPLDVPPGYQELSQKEALIRFMEWADANMTDSEDRERTIDRWVTEITTMESSGSGKQLDGIKTWDNVMKDNKLPPKNRGLCPFCGRPLHPGIIPLVNENGFVTLSNPDLSPLPLLDQVDAARRWIKKFCRHTMTINRKNGSYFLKHSIENWQKATGRKISYISNGATIQAFLEEGYICDVFGLNGCFYFEYIGPKVTGQYKGARPRIPHSIPDWQSVGSEQYRFARKGR